MSLYDGEAPETDSEDEIIVPSYLRIGDPIPSVKTTAQNFILKGTVVDGETACDNDTLDLMTTPLAIEATEEYWPSSSSPSNQTTSPLSPIYQEHELEYRKLLNEFIKSTTAKATKQIIETDKLMLGSQITLQNASLSMKQSNIALCKIKEKLENLLNDKFIPNINI